MLTIARPGDRLALVERLLDDASRVLQIVYAVNRAWQPTHKRLAERIEEGLTALQSVSPRPGRTNVCIQKPSCECALFDALERALGS